MLARRSCWARLACSRFFSVSSRTVACTSDWPSISMRASSTVAGNSSPDARRQVHSNEQVPSRMAVSSRSETFSAEALPSGCRAAEKSSGPRPSSSASR